ncbi:TPA: hypothetical protein H2W85_003212 [Salmonella enterica]|nr:hypothetical protein [Salmonella enterica]
MKLTICNKYTSRQGMNATVEVEAERGKTLCSVCTMDLSVPLVEGKLIDHYDEDLKAKAREVISQMHTELVCGGCGSMTLDVDGSTKIKGKIPCDRIVCDVKLCSGFALNDEGIIMIRTADISGLKHGYKRPDNEVMNKETLMAIYELAFTALKNVTASQGQTATENR